MNTELEAPRRKQWGRWANQPSFTPALIGASLTGGLLSAAHSLSASKFLAGVSITSVVITLGLSIAFGAIRGTLVLAAGTLLLSAISASRWERLTAGVTVDESLVVYALGAAVIGLVSVALNASETRRTGQGSSDSGG